MGRRVSIRHLHWTGLPSSCCGRQPRLPLLCALLRPPLGGHLGPSRAAQRSALPSRSPWAGNPPPGPEWLCSGFAEGLHQRRVRPPCWPATSCSGSSGTARNWPGATAALPAAGCYVTRLRGMSFLPTSRPPATGAAAPEKVSGAAPEGGRSCPDGAGRRPTPSRCATGAAALASCLEGRLPPEPSSQPRTQEAEPGVALHKQEGRDSSAGSCPLLPPGSVLPADTVIRAAMETHPRPAGITGGVWGRPTSSRGGVLLFITGLFYSSFRFTDEQKVRLPVLPPRGFRQ